MRYLEKYNSFVKKNQDYKLITVHNKILKRLELDSSILSLKTIPIIGIYKIFKNMLIQDDIQLSDELLVSMVILVLLDKITKNIEKSKLLFSELENNVPDFQILIRKFKICLHSILVIVNIVFKRDKLIISSFKKLFDVKIISKVLNVIGIFTLEHNIGLQEFSDIIHKKDQKVLKNIVEFINSETSKDRYYIEGLLLKENVTSESINYTFKDSYNEQRYKPHLDKINNAKIGDILDNEDIYLFVEYLVIQADKFEDCFVDGDLGDRLEEYEKYKLKEIPIDKLNLNEWDLDDDYVEEYKNKYLENKDYPPIVVDRDYGIIDGLHRANALKKSGLEKIMAFVGI